MARMAGVVGRGVGAQRGDVSAVEGFGGKGDGVDELSRKEAREGEGAGRMVRARVVRVRVKEGWDGVGDAKMRLVRRIMKKKRHIVLWSVVVDG